MNEIVIVGVGEIAEMAFEYFSVDSPYRVVAFAAERKYLDKISRRDSEMFGLPVVAVEDLPQKFPPQKYRAFVAMGYGRLNHDREKLYNFVSRAGYDFVSYISSRAFIGVDVTIGKNCFILENNVIQRKVTIGDNVFLWSGNHVGHRSIIKNHVFFSSHVAVSGFCEIGEYCFLGINSCIADRVKISPNCFVDGGVYVAHDTEPYELYRSKSAQPERLSTKMVFGFKEEIVVNYSANKKMGGGS